MAMNMVRWWLCWAKRFSWTCACVCDVPVGQAVCVCVFACMCAHKRATVLLHGTLLKTQSPRITVNNSLEFGLHRNTWLWKNLCELRRKGLIWILSNVERRSIWLTHCVPASVKWFLFLDFFLWTYDNHSSFYSSSYYYFFNFLFFFTYEIHKYIKRNLFLPNFESSSVRPDFIFPIDRFIPRRNAINF